MSLQFISRCDFFLLCDIYVYLCVIFIYFITGEFNNKALTFWVIADFDSAEGRELANTAVEYTVSQ